MGEEWAGNRGALCPTAVDSQIHALFGFPHESPIVKANAWYGKFFPIYLTFCNLNFIHAFISLHLYLILNTAT